MNGETTKQQVRNRVREAALFLAGLLLVVGVLYGVGHPSYHVGPRAKPDRVLWGDGAEAVVVGNSHGYCIKLDAMGLSGRNLSRGGQDMLEATYKASVVLDRAARLSWLFIPISLFSFGYDNVAKTAVRHRKDMSQRIDMYAGFPSLMPLPGDRNSYVKGMLHPLVTKDHWKRVWERLLSPPKAKAEVPASEEGGRTEGAAESPSVDDEQAARREEAARSKAEKKAKKKRDKWLRRQVRRLTRHAKRRCRRIRSGVQRALRNEPAIPKNVLAALAHTVVHARARGVRLVLFTPPYHVEYNRCIPDAWKEQVSESMARLVREHGAEYVDSHDDPEFVKRHEWFDNSDHLNKRGGRAFSEKLWRLLGTRP